MKENHLDVGFAFDGDADRCIAVDETGSVVDGDGILYILAARLKSRDMLDHNTMVATVMSNSGLLKALQKIGVRCVQTAVGDRFVYECMQNGGYRLGGEHSGHIILKKYATTGDGILTAIMLTEEMRDEKAALSALAKPVVLLPQRMRNLRVFDKAAAISDRAVQAKLEEVQGLIGDNGRILLRESGTEPVVRIMAEADSAQLCETYIGMLADVMQKRGLCCD